MCYNQPTLGKQNASIHTQLVFGIDRLNISVLLPDQWSLLQLFLTPGMSILQVQHSRGASNRDLHKYFGYWRIVSSCMEPLRIDWSNTAPHW